MLAPQRCRRGPGVVPVGSGNDFAKMRDVGHDRVRAVARLGTATSRASTPGGCSRMVRKQSRIRLRPQAVVQSATRCPVPGLSIVPRADREDVLHVRAPLFDVAAPGFRERGYMLMVEACNGTTGAASYRFAPDATPRTGKWTSVIRRVSLPRFLLAIPRVMTGRI